LPQVLLGFDKFQPNTNSPIQSIPIYKNGGVRKVLGRAEVSFTTQPLNSSIDIEGHFSEVRWDFPGFSGSGLTDGQTVQSYIGSSSSPVIVNGTSTKQGYSKPLPLSTPTAKEWLGLIGKEVLYDFHCQEWENQIWKITRIKCTVPA
jgi:hypothetical protein